MDGETEATVQTQEEQPTEPVMTKGEAILNRLGMVADGLKLLSTAGNKYDLVREITGSNTGAQRLRDVVKGDKFFYTLVMSMVKSKNPRLVSATVEQVVDSFIDTLLDLSRPYKA